MSETFAPLAPTPAPSAPPVVLDAADQAVPAALRRDGRASLTEPQKVTGLSETAVKRRLERLRGTGVLHLAVEYDSEPLGQGVEALLWPTVAPGALAGAGAAVAALSEVWFAAAVTGRANLVVSALCRTTDDLCTFLSERIGGLAGVHTAETVITLRRVKTLT
ncbi:Lrp/AsnC family transcriptional regulator [Streptomyces sp. PU_AKi4]|uniref:Lrp/AsnC family transcriptional regulator n=1 Tax=Streptomyces sp. PU_AKi4 TaxID=2800809 RepID=UPI003524EA13